MFLTKSHVELWKYLTHFQSFGFVLLWVLSCGVTNRKRKGKPHEKVASDCQNFYIAFGKSQALIQCCSICSYSGITPVSSTDF